MEKVSLDFSPKWFALYTKSRHEKFVEEQLNKKGIEAFTPKRRLKRIWSDRTKIIEEPVFKSYCFAKFSLADKLKVVSQKGVVEVVHFKHQYVPVPENVVRSLKIVLESQLRIDPYPYLEIGEKVLVKKGPLKGLEGFITEKRAGGAKIVISVSAITSSIACVVNGGFV